VNNDQSLIEVEDAEIISAEDMRTSFGLVDRGTVEGIAINMREHWRGKVAGGYIPVNKAQIETARSGRWPPEWRKTRDIDGNEIIVRPGAKKEQGDLLMPDAIRVTQKTLSRGLNPLAHISIWYQAGQLIDNVNYTIMIGIAEQQGAWSFEFADMTPEDITKHKLKPTDIGKVAYLIMDSDKALLLQATMQFSAELGFHEAKYQALEMIKKSKGTGIVRNDEGLYALKGRSLDWTAEKRAGTDAIRRAFGEMTPAQIAHYASGQGFLDKQDLNTLASPSFQAVAQLPPEDQQFYLQAERTTANVKATSPNDLKEAAQHNVRVMRDGNGDDDPVEDQKDLPKQLHPSARFWQYANAQKIDRPVAAQFIENENGDFDKALKALKEDQNK
jgi:hypothetical protein